MTVTISGNSGYWRVGPINQSVTCATHRILLFHGYGQTAAELIPLAHTLALHGFESWMYDLPGHGESRTILDQAGVMTFARRRLEEVQPVAVIGYSLGARIALALNHKKTLAISPPMSADFNHANKKELLQTLRLRWVRESRPMMGLNECIRELSLHFVNDGFEGLILYAERDLSSVKDHLIAGVPATCIPDTDHLSILYHPETATAILKELRK